MSVRVRPARAAELPLIRRLLLDSLERDHGYGYRPDWHADIDDLGGAYAEAPGGALLVAEREGRLVGAIGLRPGRPRAATLAARYAAATGVAELARLVVEPSARRSGAARALVAAAVEAARERGHRILAFHTNRRNPGSVAFWREVGAVEVLDESATAGPDAEYVALHLELPVTLGADASAVQPAPAAH